MFELNPRKQSPLLGLTGMGGGIAAGGALGGADGYWILTIGDDGSTTYGTGKGIDVDSDGNVYVAGAIGSDGYVAKIKGNGSLAWDVEMVDGTCENIMVGSAGIYMQGDHSTSCIFAKMSAADGSVSWQTTSTTATGNYRRHAVLNDSLGVIYATGQKSTDVEGGGGDGLVIACGVDGTIDWARRFGSGAHDARTHCGIDYCSGTGSNTSANDIIFWSSYNPHGHSTEKGNGERIAASDGTRYGSNSVFGVQGSSWVRSDDVKVTTNDDIIFIGQYMEAAGGPFIIKMQQASWGTFDWQRKYDTTNATTFRALFVDKEATGSELNANYCAGWTTSHGESWSETAGLLVKYNASGTIQWQRALAKSNTHIEFHEIKIVGDILYVVGHEGSGDTRRLVVFKVLKDGTMTGTYGSYIYKTISNTDAGTSKTNYQLSITNAAHSHTEASSSKTFQAISPTVTKESL